MDARHRHDETLGRATPERDTSDDDVPKQAGLPIHFDASDRSQAKTPTERDQEIELPKQGSRQTVDDFLKRQKELAQINRNVQTNASALRQNNKLVPCISKRPREKKQRKMTTKRTSYTHKKRSIEPTFEEVELCHSSKSRKIISDTPKTRMNEQQVAPHMEEQQLFEKAEDQQVSELQRNRFFDSESDSDREDPMNNEEERLEEDRFEEDPLEEDRLEEDPLEEDPLEEDPLEEDSFEENRLKEDRLEEERESEVHGYGGLGPETETPKKRGRGRPRKDQKGVGASAPRSAIQLQKHWDLEDQAILAILKKHNSPFLKLSV